MLQKMLIRMAKIQTVISVDDMIEDLFAWDACMETTEMKASRTVNLLAN